MSAEKSHADRKSERDEVSWTEEAEHEDRVLAQRFLRARDAADVEGMEAAFRMLTVRYQERVHKLVHGYTKDSLEAEDVTQEVFLKLFKKLDSFQWDSAFYTWLYRIAVNTAMDWVGKRKRRPMQLSEDVSQLKGHADESIDQSPAAPLLEKERADVTRRILEELPPQYRMILVLREYEELSYLEMAEALGCSLGTVESRLFRARGHFRRILETRYPELLR